MLKHLYYNHGTGVHVMYDTDCKQFERWIANYNHASYRFKYKNTHLEFCSSYNDVEHARMLRSMRKIQNFGEQHLEFNSAMMNVYRKYIAI